MDKSNVLRYWFLFKLYLISMSIIFIVCTIFCCWICIFPATGGIITIVIWYRYAKKRLKQKGVIK